MLCCVKVWLGWLLTRSPDTETHSSTGILPHVCCNLSFYGARPSCHSNNTAKYYSKNNIAINIINSSLCFLLGTQSMLPVLIHMWYFFCNLQTQSHQQFKFKINQCRSLHWSLSLFMWKSGQWYIPKKIPVRTRDLFKIKIFFYKFCSSQDNSC